MNYINVIDRYREYREAIRELMASIVTGTLDTHLLNNDENIRKTMRWLRQDYPFIDLIYTLDPNGIQISNNIREHESREINSNDKGQDRSRRPYFIEARESNEVIVTEPYLSAASHGLCISAALRCLTAGGETKGYLVVDIDLTAVIEYLMGDQRRRRFQPLFRLVYSLIVTGLFIVVGALLYLSGIEISSLLQSDTHTDMHLKPFGVVIFLTLALAIFDLGKTTLEEEVLMHKDIFRHSSTRRTITRFIAAILIAVSIESLLMMFKSVLGSPEHLGKAVAMMGAAIGLLLGLGMYVFLDAKAEAALRLTNQRKTQGSS
jgi:hypothetical protein